MIVIKNAVVFETTGRKEYANSGIIGLSEELLPSEGYDGGFGDDDLLPMERRELADYMVKLWRKYGELGKGWWWRRWLRYVV